MLGSPDIQRAIGYGNFGITRGDGRKLAVEPASIDLHLDSVLKIPWESGLIEVADKQTYPEYAESNELIVGKRGFALASTEETVDLPPDMAGFIHGRSSVGRLGLFVHNAGFIDPGFTGDVTLELFNAAPHAIELEDGMRIAQMTLHEVDTPAQMAYSDENGNKYNGQQGPTESRLYEDFE